MGSHESAAVLHGIALLGPSQTEMTLTRAPGGGHRHRLRGARIHLANVPPEQVKVVHGVPVTSPARTVVDLARRRPYEAAVVAADSAMYRLGVPREQLTRVVKGCQRWRGNAQAAWVVEAAEPLARSPLETLGRLMCAAGENDGFIVVRLTWVDVTQQPGRSIHRIRQAIARAQRRTGES